MAQSKTSRTTVASVAQALAVTDLSGGLDVRTSPSLLKPNQSRLLRNWSLREPGALVTRLGWDEFSTTSLGNRRVQGGMRVYLADTTPFTVASDNGSVYMPSDAGVWGAAVKTGLHATEPHYFPYDRDLVAVFDATNIPSKSTDGTTWTQMGISAPSVAPSASAVAGGSLIDAHTYEVSYAYQDDGLGHTGNESATDSQATAGADLTIRVAVTASADPQVDKIVLYVRDITAGETVRRKYAEYANTTTNRDITSNTWSTNEAAPTDHNVPEAGLVAAVIWKNRWWAWTGNRLYFTQIFQPQSWPALFYIDIPFEHGDDIAAVVSQGDTLTVFGQASKPFLIIGQTSLDFEVRPALGAQAGALGPRAATIIEQGIVHAAAEGVYIFDGATDRLLSYPIEPAWQDLVQRASTADLAKIAMVYHAEQKELRIAVPRHYPWAVAGEHIIDLNRTRTQETPAWTGSDRTVGGYIYWNGAESTLGNRGRLFSWSLTVARLYEESVGTSANGSSMVCDYEGATHAMGGYRARYTQGFVEFQPAGGTFSLEAYVDGSGLGASTIAIGANLPVYGSAIYGTSTYGSAARRMRPWWLPLTAEGRTMAVRARYTGTSEFRWFTYTVHLVPEPALVGV